MNKFIIPALDLLYGRLQSGFSRRQKILAALLGFVIIVSFMFRAACPPERRFFKSLTSPSVAMCASPDMVKDAMSLQGSRGAKHSHNERPPSVL
jgi:hypothetical protein